MPDGNKTIVPNWFGTGGFVVEAWAFWPATSFFEFLFTFPDYIYPIQKLFVLLLLLVASDNRAQSVLAKNQTSERVDITDHYYVCRDPQASYTFHYCQGVEGGDALVDKGCYWDELRRQYHPCAGKCNNAKLGSITKEECENTIGCQSKCVAICIFILNLRR